jgi:hypothetical protein
LKDLKMNISLEFTAINKLPECVVYVNNQPKYQGPVTELINIECLDQGAVEIAIAFTNKSPEDTVVDSSGNIIEDKSFELERIVVGEYDLEELKWESQYQADDGATYDKCLFFGPPGKFVINIENPILPWILRTKHKHNGDDPNWQEDYNYYDKACKLLTQI